MKTAILTLDIMNEICHQDGKLAAYAERIADQGLIEKTNQLTDWARNNGHLVIHVRVGFDAHYQRCSTISPIFSAAKKIVFNLFFYFFSYFFTISIK